MEEFLLLFGESFKQYFCLLLFSSCISVTPASSTVLNCSWKHLPFKKRGQRGVFPLPVVTYAVTWSVHLRWRSSIMLGWTRPLALTADQFDCSLTASLGSWSDCVQVFGWSFVKEPFSASLPRPLAAISVQGRQAVSPLSRSISDPLVRPAVAFPAFLLEAFLGLLQQLLPAFDQRRKDADWSQFWSQEFRKLKIVNRAVDVPVHSIGELALACPLASLQEVASNLLKCSLLPRLSTFLRWLWLVAKFTRHRFVSFFLGVPSINRDPTEQMFGKREISPRGFACEIVPPLVVSFWVIGKGASRLFYEHRFTAVKEGVFPSESLQSKM